MMKRSILAAALAASLSGCAAGVPAAIEFGVLGAGALRAAYCLGVAEEGKQAVRDIVAAGRQVVYCDDAPAPVEAGPE